MICPTPICAICRISLPPIWTKGIQSTRHRCRKRMPHCQAQCRFFFLDYAKLSKGVSSIRLMDANDKKPWFPCTENDNLYNEWRTSLVVTKEQVPPLLVAIPRDAKGTFQTMTAAVIMTGGVGAGQHPTIGLRWLHCQYQ